MPRVYLARHVPLVGLGLSPSARLIVVCLWCHEARHGKGLTRLALSEWSAVGQRTFDRAWKQLLASDLLVGSRRG